MNWMNKLEKKWGRYAIPNISRFLIIAVGIGYILQIAVPGFLGFLSFSPADILRGEVWRLFTWVIYPPTGFSLLAIIFLLCLLSMGQALESFLGTFKMNVFIFGGILLNVVGGMLIYVAALLFTRVGLPIQLTIYYVLLSIFMAVAICIPDATVRLYFVLPVKMKWMLYIDLIYLAYQLFEYCRIGYGATQSMWGAVMMGIICGTQIVLSLLNLFLFFFFAKPRPSRRQKRRQREFKAEFAKPRPGSGIYHHKCAICGRTDADHPELMFRYCSKCEGNFEYCQDHLYTHEHKMGLR